MVAYTYYLTGDVVYTRITAHTRLSKYILFGFVFVVCT